MEGLKENVVIRILELHLQRILIDISDRKLDLDPWNGECLKFQGSHLSCRIMHQGLIHGEGNHFGRFNASRH